jgi:hypothetical protein
MSKPAAEAFPEPAKPAAGAKTPARAPSSPAPPAKKERVDTTPLEGVRALACAIIAANHWLLWYGEKKHGAIELQGGFAVTVFFFITGFVMYLAYGDKACREDFKYWVRRPCSFPRAFGNTTRPPSRDASASRRSGDSFTHSRFADVPKRRFGSRSFSGKRVVFSPFFSRPKKLRYAPSTDLPSTFSSRTSSSAGTSGSSPCTGCASRRTRP